MGTAHFLAYFLILVLRQHRFYDSLSRLIEADYNNGTNVYDYGYDVAGNLVNNNGTTRTYNAAHQMTNDGTNTLTYDANGNLTNDGANTYTWDRANRLLGVGNHSYVYDGLGNRVQQTVSSVVTDYLNDLQPGLTKLLVQDDGTNVDHFVHGVRGIHAVDDGTDWNFYAQDGLGSVRAVVDDVAVVQTNMSYDPYGNPMGSYGAGFGFTGEQTDGNGQVYLRARYYNPSMGVFSALDPFEGVLSRPMSLNGYSWVKGNVVNEIDPSGLCGPLCWAALVALGLVATGCNIGPIPPTEVVSPIPEATNTQAATNTATSTATSTATNTPLPTAPPTATETMMPTVAPSPFNLITASPLPNGCNIIRDYQGHIAEGQQAEAGVDYALPGDAQNGDTNAIDRLSRDPITMAARTVNAIASGRVINITRAQIPQNQTTSHNDNPLIQPGEDYGVTIETLSCDSQACLIIQYTHVFPEVNFGSFVAPDLRQSSVENVPFLRSGYASIPQQRINNLTGPEITTGQPIGYYAQIGRSTIGPHLHISMFRGPNQANATFSNWLIDRRNGGEQVDPEPYVPCSVGQ